MAALPTLPTVPSSMCTVNAVGWNFSFATDFPGEPSYRLDYTGVGWTYDAKKIPQRNNATAPVRNLVLGPAEKPTELRSNPVADGLGETWALVSRLEAAPGSSETINFEDLGGEDHDVFMVLDSAGNVLGRYPATGSDSVNNITASGTGINLSFTMPADGVVYAYSWLADFGVAWGIHVNNSCRIDYSDAASTYGTATHVIKKGLLQLGSQITLDTGVVTDADNASDDGVSTFPPLSPDLITYSVSTAVTNITGQTATLHGWIDFDRNGVFDADEYTSATVASGSTTAALNWSVPLDTVAGSTSARFRLTTDTLAAANASTAVSDGEVEDYTLTINAQTSATPNPTATACTAYRKYAVDDISAIPLKSATTTLPISFTASGGTRNPQGLTATYAFAANGGSSGTAGRTSSATLTSPWTSSSWSPVEFSSTPTTPSSSASYNLVITLSQAMEGVGIMIGDIDKSAGSTGAAEGVARVMFKDAAGGVVPLTQSTLPVNTTATTSNYYLGSNLLAYGTAGAIANLGGNIATAVANSYATYQVSPNQKVKTIEIQYGGGDYLFSPVWYTDCYDYGDTPANGSTAPNG
ncbi:GEVED domain-containing protein, partial [Thiofilum flexile]|uniref:GEVED domain-containing protein n=1 Tax=Thiofilum flexile TaxID=125627 RepID=UPI000476C4C1